VKIRKRFFAWLLKQGDSFNHALYGDIKRELFQGIKGTVLEIGPGSGVNFKYLKNVEQWFGIEPNDFFHEDILKVGRQEGIPVSLIKQDAESISLTDNSVDHVICTLVLCSVPDPDKAIREIKRVLKPGGSLIFIEHVCAPEKSTLYRVQNFLNPLNKIIADGCNCNRKTWETLDQAGFSKLELNHFVVSGAIKLHSPHIRGIAYK
jgi:ubiquinone/menaquinone biosynthesis C-methylase UbiE